MEQPLPPASDATPPRPDGLPEALDCQCFNSILRETNGVNNKHNDKASYHDGIVETGPLQHQPLRPPLPPKNERIALE